MSDSHAPTSNEPPTPIDPARARQSPPRLTLTSDAHFEDEFDALAELFLEEDEPASPRASVLDPDRLPVEGLILGHLPVSASSWVKTYAAMRARALGGPVGLVRLMGESMAIDLVGVDSRGAGESLTLDEAIEALRRRAVSVIVRTDEIREPELIRHGIGGLVVLSGADEAAIAGAFRTIRSVVEEASRHGEIPAMRCAIFGDARERAEDAFERLARSVRHSLSCEIAFGGSVQRLASEVSATLYAGPATISCGALIERLHGEGVAPPEHGRPEVPARSDIEDATIPRERPDAVEAIGASAPASEAEAVETSAGTGAEAVEATRAAPEQHDAPAAPAGDDNTATLLAGVLEGARGTQIRSPYAPEVELVLDGKGRLYAVADMDDLGRALGVLCWARDHEELLKLAEPAMQEVDGGLVVVCDDAKRARAILDTEHKVVLRVRVGEHETCVALN